MLLGSGSRSSAGVFELLTHPSGELCGGLLCECDHRQLVRLRVARLDDANDAVNEDGRLACAGAGFDAQVVADADGDLAPHGVVLRDEVSELALAIQEVGKTLKVLVGSIPREDGESRRLLCVVARTRLERAAVVERRLRRRTTRLVIDHAKARPLVVEVDAVDAPLQLNRASAGVDDDRIGRRERIFVRRATIRHRTERHFEALRLHARWLGFVYLMVVPADEVLVDLALVDLPDQCATGDAALLALSSLLVREREELREVT